MIRTHRRSHAIGVDLFPFLAVILCCVGVQAVVLLLAAVIQPLIQRRATIVEALNAAETHTVVVEAERWSIPEIGVSVRADPAILRGGAAHGGDWKQALTKLAEAVASKNSEHPSVIEVRFAQSEVPSLRHTLGLLDELQDRLAKKNGRTPFSLRYRFTSRTTP